MNVQDLKVTFSINRFHKLAILAINIPLVILGREPVIPSWCMSIKGPK